MMHLWVDIALSLSVLVTAAAAIGPGSLFRNVVMFIAVGLILSLIWVRLEAPDLALAEAAIGAGLTGVLFLDTVAHIKRHSKSKAINKT